MAKKTEKKYISINEVNIEIDYDKLADAIVIAQNRQTAEYSVTREWMKMLLIPIFWGIALVLGLLGIALMLYGGNLFAVAVRTSAPDWVADACIGGVEFTFGMFALAVAFLSGATAKEVDKEKDKNFVVAVFSGIVSLVALVVSFVALMQGVG